MLNSRGWLVLAVSIATVASSLGCASTPQEVDLPPQTLTEAPTSTAEQEAALVSSSRSAPADPEEDYLDDELADKPEAPPAEAAAAQPQFADRKHTIVIQSGGTSHIANPRTLQEASESERERRAGTTAPPVAVITNKNLAELAEGGQITIVGPDGRPLPAEAPAGEGAGSAPGTTGAGSVNASAPPAPTTGTAAPAASTATTAAGAPATSSAAAKPPSAEMTEEYWRSQALKIRLDWKAAVEEVDELQGEVADLRRRFYQEDDPHYRDNQIKPEWDRTLDRLQDAKTAAETQERKLTRFLEEGHRAGALPGWLREGVEFEPPATPDNTPAQRRRTNDPWEPKVLEEESRDP